MVINLLKGLLLGGVVLLGSGLVIQVLINVLEILVGLGVLGFSMPLILLVAYLVGNALMEIRRDLRIR